MPPTPKRKSGADDFVIGTIYAAWFLVRAHGEDNYAKEMLNGVAPVAALQRLARREDYRFPRGFWAQMRRRAEANR